MTKHRSLVMVTSTHEQVVVSSEGMTTCSFGPFRLDRSAGQLRRGDAVVPLAPKAFTVLQHLVTHSGQLITKDELLELAWADVHVGDGALKVCVREIRRALQDDPRTPAYIETAHRRGYRFIAPVTVEAASPVPPGLTVVPAGPASSLMTVPDTHYARSGDVNIAYQVIGNGPRDLVFIMGWVSHLDYFWAEPSFARFLHRLATFSRLILIDKRGTGLSDRVTELPTLEQRMDDVRAVMDQVGSNYAALLGVSEGGPMCALFAATYPEKTRALVMIGTYAKRKWDPEYPWGPTPEASEAFYKHIRDDWGGPIGIEVRAPSMASDPGVHCLVVHLPADGREPRRRAGVDAHECGDRHPRDPAAHPCPDARAPPPSRSVPEGRGRPLRRQPHTRRTDSSSCQVRITCRLSAIRTPSSTRSNGS